jgi:hypothetical protein
MTTAAVDSVQRCRRKEANTNTKNPPTNTPSAPSTNGSSSSPFAAICRAPAMPPTNAAISSSVPPRSNAALRWIEA